MSIFIIYFLFVFLFFILADGGLLLPLKTRHGWSRRRELLRNGALPVLGSVKDLGYFYVDVELGTPPRLFSLIIDTGSTMTYVPCKTCQHCGKHKDEAFDVTKSSSVHQLNCQTPLCNCGSPPCQCMQDKCYYSRSYAERSSSAGFLLEDLMKFPDGGEPVRVVFGCENDEMGEIFKQMADGLIGMGNNNNALHSQLVGQKIIEDTFGLCFSYPDGGTMVLGNVEVEGQSTGMKYTPLTSLRSNSHFYTVDLISININKVSLNIPVTTWHLGYGVVMDSGTTFTYMPTPAFQAVVAAMNAYTASKKLQSSKGSDPQYNDVCWKGIKEGKLESVFPEVFFEFSPHVQLNMTPLQYLFKVDDGWYCLGIFDNQQQGTLIGGISVRNVLIQYDRRSQRIGFLPTNCKNLTRAASPAVHPLPVPSPAARSPSPPPMLTPPLNNNSTENKDPPAVPPPLKPAASVLDLDKEDDFTLDDGDGLSVVPGSNTVSRSTSFVAAMILVVIVLILSQLAFTYRARIYELLAYGKLGGQYNAVSTAELTPTQKV